MKVSGARGCQLSKQFLNVAQDTCWHCCKNVVMHDRITQDKRQCQVRKGHLMSSSVKLQKPLRWDVKQQVQLPLYSLVALLCLNNKSSSIQTLICFEVEVASKQAEQHKTELVPPVSPRLFPPPGKHRPSRMWIRWIWYNPHMLWLVPDEDKPWSEFPCSYLGNRVILCLLQIVLVCEVQQSQSLVTGPFSILFWFVRKIRQTLVLRRAAGLHIGINDKETGRKEAKEGASRGHYRNDTHAANCLHHTSEGRCNQNLADIDLEMQENTVWDHNHTKNIVALMLQSLKLPCYYRPRPKPSCFWICSINNNHVANW